MCYLNCSISLNVCMLKDLFSFLIWDPRGGMLYFANTWSEDGSNNGYREDRLTDYFGGSLSNFLGYRVFFRSEASAISIETTLIGTELFEIYYPVNILSSMLSLDVVTEATIVQLHGHLTGLQISITHCVLNLSTLILFNIGQGPESNRCERKVFLYE